MKPTILMAEMITLTVVKHKKMSLIITNLIKNSFSLNNLINIYTTIDMVWEIFLFCIFPVYMHTFHLHKKLFQMQNN